MSTPTGPRIDPYQAQMVESDEPARPDERTRPDEPARSDGLVRGLSEAIGGPLGDHAVRPPRSARGGARFWTPVRVVLALVCLTLSLHWVQKSPCSDGAWENLSQYRRLCYTDVLALYYAERLGEGAIPYVDHAVEYPVLTGALMGVLGLPIHAVGKNNETINQGEWFYDLNALVLGAFAVATVAAILAVRRKRPWDAALFALSPALFVSATVNWDLLAVGLTALFMYAWTRRKPVLAGVLLGLATAAKFYPLLLAGALLVLAIRTGRWRAFLLTLGTATSTWLAVNLPVALAYRDSWLEFFRLNGERGVDWGTIWYIGEHFPRGAGRQGFDWFISLNREPGHNQLDAIYFTLFMLACLAIAVLTLRAPRRPRLAQIAFLIIAVFLVFGKVWSQQYVLWLLPLVVLARPRWGAFLAWQVAEVCYFAAFNGALMGASGKPLYPEGVFILASMLRLATVGLLIGLVVRDIVHPEHDVVRREHDDPDGGVFDRAPDAGWVRRQSMV